MMLSLRTNGNDRMAGFSMSRPLHDCIRPMCTRKLTASSTIWGRMPYPRNAQLQVALPVEKTEGMLSSQLTEVPSVLTLASCTVTSICCLSTGRCASHGLLVSAATRNGQRYFDSFRYGVRISNTFMEARRQLLYLYLSASHMVSFSDSVIDALGYCA